MFDVLVFVDPTAIGYKTAWSWADGMPNGCRVRLRGPLVVLRSQIFPESHSRTPGAHSIMSLEPWLPGSWQKRSDQYANTAASQHSNFAVSAHSAREFDDTQRGAQGRAVTVPRRVNVAM